MLLGRCTSYSWRGPQFTGTSTGQSFREAAFPSHGSTELRLSLCPTTHTTVVVSLVLGAWIGQYRPIQVSSLRLRNRLRQPKLRRDAVRKVAQRCGTLVTRQRLLRDAMPQGFHRKERIAVAVLPHRMSSSRRLTDADLVIDETTIVLRLMGRCLNMMKTTSSMTSKKILYPAKMLATKVRRMGEIKKIRKARLHPRPFAR